MEAEVLTESAEISNEVAEEILILVNVIYQNNDRAAQLLRLHALTEWYIERILQVLLKKPDIIINDSRFTYSHKLKLAYSMNGIDEKEENALRRLSKLRNECAHSMAPQITDKQIIDASQPIAEEFKLAMADRKKDGIAQDVFQAYIWAIFSQLSQKAALLEMIHEGIYGESA
ncbi:hypothetical protein ABIE61_000948 [Marinobacterium sp. MBR-111]|jgi:hypothetical protein|uniref:hypothetical protein n=1 Tax=Marinobacterium sp. MBR-111 TaxID=3156463 RepID=UPI00339376AF